MDQQDRNDEARRLLADIEHEIAAIRQEIGLHGTEPAAAVATSDADAPVALEAADSAEPADIEVAAAQPPPAPPGPAEPSPPTFEQRLARIAAS